MSLGEALPHRDDNPPGPILASLRLYAPAAGGVAIRGRYVDSDGHWQDAKAHVDYAGLSDTLARFGIDDLAEG